MIRITRRDPISRITTGKSRCLYTAEATAHTASRAIVLDTLSTLISTLDAAQGIKWAVELVEDPKYYVLQSVVNPNTDKRKVELQLWVQRDPFQITAVRVLENQGLAEKLPQMQSFDSSTIEKLHLTTSKGAEAAVVWKTKPRGLQYRDNATILSVEKSATADYMGFGEQGGKNLFKKKTYMNYFSMWATTYPEDMH